MAISTSPIVFVGKAWRVYRNIIQKHVQPILWYSHREMILHSRRIWWHVSIYCVTSAIGSSVQTVADRRYSTVEFSCVWPPSPYLHLQLDVPLLESESLRSGCSVAFSISREEALLRSSCMSSKRWQSRSFQDRHLLLQDRTILWWKKGTEITTAPLCIWDCYHHILAE